MAQAAYGYFVWSRSLKGGPTPSKADGLMWKNGMPETVKSREQQTVAEYPLTEGEFKLSLDKLAEKYPPPGGAS